MEKDTPLVARKSLTTPGQAVHLASRLPHTIYHRFGIDATRQYHDRTGRPFAILPSGRPIDELI
jgi:hypothetical protein